jgi:hypothetical protein
MDDLDFAYELALLSTHAGEINRPGDDDIAAKGLKSYRDKTKLMRANTNNVVRVTFREGTCKDVK